MTFPGCRTFAFPSLYRLVFLALSVLELALFTSAVLVNHTIDDQLMLTANVLRYVPPNGVWSQGQTCTTCLIHPGIIDVDKAFDGTWSYAAYQPGQQSTEVQAFFNGTAVYVYNIVPNTVPGAATFVNLTFSIDGIYRGRYIFIPNESSEVLYNVSVFSATDLSQDVHNLTMNVVGNNASHVLFDYIVYTTDEPDPSNPGTDTTATPTSSSNKAPTPLGAIVGGVIGGAAALLLAGVLLLILLCRRRSHRQARENALPPPATPFYISSTERMIATQTPTERVANAHGPPPSRDRDMYQVALQRSDPCAYPHAHQQYAAHTPVDDVVSPLSSSEPRHSDVPPSIQRNVYRRPPAEKATPTLVIQNHPRSDFTVSDGSSLSNRSGSQVTESMVRAQVTAMLHDEIKKLAMASEANRVPTSHELPPYYDAR
ncbi:hypothetical protein C8Q70DRAFT_195615 [Cubamyces menziesii]|uniref:Uncharacterized protein n=1 Tax=Trametes cubensis TaxID=1111947 RepID=A0AAD7XCW6_9APHY|nr:hypothetical protein C8Q70DRAFT_195615 [Cubamyces menziesii]KAJ8487594.1 hypothetical protein ONZ51_g4085 [Trametes cubensis]